MGDKPSHLLSVRALAILRKTAVFCEVFNDGGECLVVSFPEVYTAAQACRMRVSEHHRRAILDNYEGLTLWGDYDQGSRNTTYRSLLLKAKFSWPDSLNRSHVVFTVSRFAQQREPKYLEPEITEVVEFQIDFNEKGTPRLSRLECFSDMHADTLAHSILFKIIPDWPDIFFPKLSDYPAVERALGEMLTPGFKFVESKKRP